MPKTKYAVMAILLAILLAPEGRTTSLEELPLLYPDPQPPVRRDYLVEDIGRTANVYRSPVENELVLDNGLVRRTWRMEPSVACVGYDNRMTGQSMLRAVRPEARVTIDGTPHDVGGLIGQPNHAYITTGWLEQMEPLPSAFQLVGFEVGKPTERFAWGRRRHTAPDVAWPPSGVYLRMDYELRDGQRHRTQGVDNALQTIWSDDFHELSPAWRIKASAAHPRTSFQNEGKPGEIYALADAHCYAERDVPSDTIAMEAAISPGTDTSASWGPGLAWVFRQGVVKVNLRPGDRGAGRHVELRVNGQEQLTEVTAFAAPDGGLEVAATYHVRMRREGSRLIVEAAVPTQAAANYHRLFAVEIDDAWGDTVAMRVGKMDREGGATDSAPEAGELVRLRIVQATASRQKQVPAPQAAGGTTAAAAPNPASIRLSVHYELYDGVPVMSKWITVENRSDRTITIDRFVSEELALVEDADPTQHLEDAELPRPNYLHVETDFVFGGSHPGPSNHHVVHWRADPDYSTQVDYHLQTPCLLVCAPTYGPAQEIPAGGTFVGFRVFELAYDDGNRERRGLAYRRMYRCIAPWVTENPITHHLLSNDPAGVREAIDAAANVGFEAIILSFGSGFNMENRDPEFLQVWKQVADYAEQRGIELGCYSLLSSRAVAAKDMTVSPPGQQPQDGQIPSLTSEWGQQWLRTIREFYDVTGFDQFENDGPYPGDIDVTPRPPLQKGIEDSRWVQWQANAKLYRELRGKGVYIDQPSYQFVNGGNKTGMGYRETNWSLPRAQQVIHTRQNIYDGTWMKTPSMGWMHIPLAEYQGGGAAATVEPLSEHIDHYERLLLSNFGMGVQAHCRGPRLYDTEATRQMLKSTVDWFKAYRDILESDIIHGRRADGRDLDWVLHVNPKLETKGMLCVYNPLDQEVTRTLHVNLYYTGLRKTAHLSRQGGPYRRVDLTDDHSIDLEVTVPPLGMSWYPIR